MSRFYREWVDAVRTDAAGAMAIHQAVLHELERRRRAAAHLGKCIDPGTVGLQVLRFAVDVQEQDGRLHIGSAHFFEAHFFEVSSGMPVSDRSARCLQDALSGDAVVEPAAGRFYNGYRGRVNYIAQLELGDGNR